MSPARLTSPKLVMNAAPTESSMPEATPTPATASRNTGHEGDADSATHNMLNRAIPAMNALPMPKRPTKNRPLAHVDMRDAP